MKTSRYTKLGVLITFSIAIVIWGMNYLKGIDLFKNNKTFHIKYDRIDGLVESSAVTLSGYEVGQVSEIKFSDSEPGMLIVSISIQGEFNITEGSVARIVSSDLLGTRSIKLLLADANTYYIDNDTIPGSIEEALADQVSMQVLPLKNKAEELLASLDSAITVVTYVFNAEARQNLSESFEHINKTILNLEQSSEKFNNLLGAEQENIQSIIYNLKTLSTTLSENSENFGSISENLATITDSIADAPIKSMMTSMSGSIEQINLLLSKINSNEGTAGLLVNDPDLYNNLTALSSSLDYLLNDLRNNPKRYVHFSAFDFGKNLYISPTDNVDSDTASEYIFKLNLISSSTPIDLKSDIFNDYKDVEELEISGVYNYLTSGSNDFYEVLDQHESAVLKFPDASVVAFKNGRQVKLEKALRKSSK